MMQCSLHQTVKGRLPADSFTMKIVDPSRRCYGFKELPVQLLKAEEMLVENVGATDRTNDVHGSQESYPVELSPA